MSYAPKAEHSCASFISPDNKLDSRSGDCVTCGFSADGHITVDQLEKACQSGQARLVVDKPSFRRYVHNGFRFDCLRNYTKDVAPFGLSGFAMYQRGWRVAHKQIDTWQPRPRVA